MESYIQLLFEGIAASQSEVLIAELNEAGFEGFEEDDTILKAFIAGSRFDELQVTEIAQRLQLVFSKTVIETTNWNQLWESSFQPVIVDDFVAIRAGFHKPVAGVALELIITPKMSFGTGHHATTYLVLSAMKHIDFTNKNVLDFGTGTGVLAILAGKLGAAAVLAIDNDDWSIANATENIAQNNVAGIEIKKAGSAGTGGSFDIILANINKNIILENLSLLAGQLAPTGILVLSGLLREDADEIILACKTRALRLLDRAERHNWLTLKLSY